MAVTLGNLGAVAEHAGDNARASRLYEESLGIARAIGNQRSLAAVLHRQAGLAWARGDRPAARSAYAECLQLWQALGDRRATLRCLMESVCLCAAEQPETALRLSGAAEALAAQLDVPVPSAAWAGVERALRPVRRRMGADGAAAAVATGRGLSLDDAVAQASAGLMSTEPRRRDTVPSRQPGALLSPRERQVAALVVRGKTNREIADALGIAERTADTHLTNILNKLGVGTRTQIAVWAVQHGLAQAHSSAALGRAPA